MLCAATQAAIRSAPTDEGVSQCIPMPVLMPGPTKRGGVRNINSSAFLMTELRGGTTEDTIAPFISDLSMPCRERASSSLTAYSSSVLEQSVDRRKRTAAHYRENRPLLWCCFLCQWSESFVPVLSASYPIHYINADAKNQDPWYHHRSFSAISTMSPSRKPASSR